MQFKYYTGSDLYPFQQLTFQIRDAAEDELQTRDYCELGEFEVHHLIVYTLCSYTTVCTFS